ncbi:winged helix-turn-helix domain-containing protein, partial [Stutzerimonas stutzeri]
DTGVLWCGEKSVALSPAELQIMVLLLRTPQDVVRRTALEAAAWGLSEAVTPNALDVALHRIRRKLLVIGSGQIIINVRGHGYALREQDAAQ